MIRLAFTEQMRERLRHERIHHPHPRVRQRLEALYLKSADWSHQAICASVGITKPTLIGYLRLFQDGGWTALTTCRFRPGPAARWRLMRRRSWRRSRGARRQPWSRPAPASPS